MKINNYIFFAFFFLLLVSHQVFTNNNLRFVFIVPTYNNKEFFKKNLDSIFMQDYENYRIIYIDDHSSDGTADLVEEYTKNAGFEDKLKLIRNQERCYTLCNVYRAAHMCNDDEIIIFLDGDDFLFHPSVLSLLAEEYVDDNLWLTYGNHIKTNGEKGNCKEISSDVIAENVSRYKSWVFSHLRTCRAWLFKMIQLQDLLYESNFYTASCDLAIMYPMIEMAGEGHFKFIENILCIYNVGNNLSHERQRNNKQLFFEDIIRKKKRYAPLKGKIDIGNYIEKEYSIGLVIVANNSAEQINKFLEKAKKRDFGKIFVFIDKKHLGIKYLQRKFPEIIFFTTTFTGNSFDLSKLSSHISFPLYLICSTNNEDIFSKDLLYPSRILKQTRAFVYGVHTLNSISSISGAYIDDTIRAYQMGCPTVDITSTYNSWAYLITRKELRGSLDILPQLIYNNFVSLPSDLAKTYKSKVILYTT